MIPTRLWILRIVIWISIIQASECGVLVSISPLSVASKSNTPVKTSIECSLSSDTNVNVIYAMKILRKSKRETYFVTIAQVKHNTPPEIPASAPYDVKERRAHLSCGIDINRPVSSKLKLDFDTKDLVCDDTGEYKCTVMYDDDNDIPITGVATETLEVDSADWEKFMCYFNCLGGIGAIGLGGVLALIALVKLSIYALGFTTAGIVAGSIAAKLMAWYGGTVAAGSLFAILQSIGAAGIGFKAILTALFGSTALTAALKGGCSDCGDMC